MEELIITKQFFKAKDILECGQIFRFEKIDEEYIVYSRGEACLIIETEDKVVLKCTNKEYFSHFFDLETDYSEIVDFAYSLNSQIISEAVSSGIGIRILNQDIEEMIFSFLISQNNHIPRIKKIIERICRELGEKKEFLGHIYYSFPSSEKMANASEEFFKNIGAGYRASYLDRTAKRIMSEFKINSLQSLSDAELKKKLLSLHGVGAKVADCIMLFAFKRTFSFPVDTWIEKVYKEDLGGTETDRVKIAKELSEKFGIHAGYIQQYLFNHKRWQSHF